jgi:putative transposase
MPRAARNISESGVYHIMLRGINKQVIFEDEEDRLRFIETLKRYKEISQCEIYAYCIMSNHIHILLREKDEAISSIIKRISSSYVFWYNKKYERCGHLFQERYKSEAVDNDAYFLTVLRYIHQNPVKAGLVQHVRSYQWSSYSEYINEGDMIDKDFVLQMFSSDKNKALALFTEYNTYKNNDVCMEMEEKTGAADEEIRRVLAQHGVKEPYQFKTMEKSKRNNIIKNLKSVNGVSIRQLARITGISKSAIGKI